MHKNDVRDALRGVTGPGAEKGLVAAAAVEWVASCDGQVSVRLHMPACSGEADYVGVSERAGEAIARKAAGMGEKVESLTIEFVDRAGAVLFTARGGANAPKEDHAGASATAASGSASASTSASPGHRPIPGLREGGSGSGGSESRAPKAQDGSSGLPGVRHAIAVGAGKGGVGKSSVAVNLAVGLARRGHSVGLMDGDIYGPSLPTMLGLEAMEQVVREGLLQPYLVHGVKAITIGKLVDPEKPLIWRGPMAHGAFKQLTEQTQWGELEYLIVDLPPGTGDVSLTMAQTLKLTGAVVVCTPQKVAQDDAVRAARMRVVSRRVRLERLYLRRLSASRRWSRRLETRAGSTSRAWRLTTSSWPSVRSRRRSLSGA